MFTGITQGLFPVNSLLKDEGLLQYTVVLNETLIKDLKIGASVAIDGVCQTVVTINGSVVTFEAMSETLDKTTISDLFIGRKVSVERSLRFGEEIGGHEVSGHIFEKGIIIARKERANNLSLTIQCSDACFVFIKSKGFVALDGSSLTVDSLNKAQRSFEVYLIPETLRVTNFENKDVASYVNLEPDIKTMILVETVQASFSDIQVRLEKIEKQLENLE
ncbi:MAG: riboflavin synthase subunit alpha [Pseudomonadota bacterium]